MRTVREENKVKRDGECRLQHVAWVGGVADKGVGTRKKTQESERLLRAGNKI